jgi:hypothetical protein
MAGLWRLETCSVPTFIPETEEEKVENANLVKDPSGRVQPTDRVLTTRVPYAIMPFLT